MTRIYQIIVAKNNLPKIVSVGGRNERRAQSPPPRWNRCSITPGVIGLSKIGLIEGIHEILLSVLAYTSKSKMILANIILHTYPKKPLALTEQILGIWSLEQNIYVGKNMKREKLFDGTILSNNCLI